MLGIAIVHYHAEALLTACLQSLRRSRFQDFTICIVDNGSRDGLDVLAGGDPRVLVVRAPRNIGFAAATNLAVSRLAPEVDHVLLLNPDVIVGVETLDIVLRELESDGSIGVVTCRLLQASGETDPACRRSDPTLFSGLMRYLHLPRLAPWSRTVGAYNLTYLSPDSPHDIGSGTAAFLLMHRRVFEAVRGFDERFFLYGEDLDLCRRIREAGYRIRYQPAATALHVKGSGRIRGMATTCHFYKASWTYYRKWGRFRRNPVVLIPLAAALALLACREAASNAVRATLQRGRTTAARAVRAWGGVYGGRSAS